jgi:hypothetical protein
MVQAEQFQRSMVTTELKFVLGQLHLAVLGMARGEKPVAERLANAYLLHLRPLAAAELPACIRADWDAVHGEFARMLPDGEVRSVKEAVARLDAATARDLVERVVEMYERVCRRSGVEE